MDRALPTSNKIVSRKINERNRQIHLAKLSNIKSTISRQPPPTFSHLKSNKKKIQLDEDRLTEIERENKILLAKMTSIMKSGHQLSTPSLEKSTPKSLNLEYRKRELVKITIENQSIMRRLQDQKPIYKRQLWEDSRKQHEAYLKNITEFPSMTLSNFKVGERTSEVNERPQTYNVNRETVNSITSPKTSEKFYTPLKDAGYVKQFQPIRKLKGDKLDPLNSSSTNQKTLLYQAKKKIGFNNYLVHIYFHNNQFNIIASNNDRADFKTLTLTKKEGIRKIVCIANLVGEDLVKHFGGDYNELVERIRFQGQNIVLENLSMSVGGNDEKVSGSYAANDGIAEAEEDENDPDGSKGSPGYEKAKEKKQKSDKNLKEKEKEDKPTETPKEKTKEHHVEKKKSTSKAGSRESVDDHNHKEAEKHSDKGHKPKSLEKIDHEEKNNNDEHQEEEKHAVVYQNKEEAREEDDIDTPRAKQAVLDQNKEESQEDHHDTPKHKEEQKDEDRDHEHQHNDKTEHHDEAVEHNEEEQEEKHSHHEKEDKACESLDHQEKEAPLEDVEDHAEIKKEAHDENNELGESSA